MTAEPIIPIFDGHNDTISHLCIKERGGGRSFFKRSDVGHIDLPRAREGGFVGGLFAVFSPNPEEENVANTQNEKKDYTSRIPAPVDQEYAAKFITGEIAMLYRLEAEAAGQIKVVRTADELTTCLDNNTIAVVLHMEGAEAIDTDLDNLHVYYQAGLRSVGLTWSRANAFGNGVPFMFPHSPDIGDGLTNAGKRLVKECNTLKIVVDVSHLNEKGFWDVAQITDAPIVATHCAAHALCQTSRNLIDKQLDAIGESDGMVGVNFNCAFIREDGKGDSDTPLSDIVRHVAYIADRIGIDHVGVGSDFDGATMPDDLKDVTGMPKLVTALQAHGFNNDELKKIACDNWIRVLTKTWDNE